MSRKRKNGKTIAGIVGGLACMAVVSVGFASWVITYGEEHITTGEITVESATSQVHTVTGAWDNGVHTIVYGKTTQTSGVNERVSNATIGDENLHCRYVATVANCATTDTLANVMDIEHSAVVFNWGTVADRVFTASESGWPVAQAGAFPTVKYNTAYDSETAGVYVNFTAPTAPSTDGKITIDIQFKWGDAFNGVNPMLTAALNTSIEMSQAEKLNELVSNLNTLNTALAGKTFQLKLTTK